MACKQRQCAACGPQHHPDGEVDKDGNPKLVPASLWLDKCRPCDQMVWAPGAPMIVINQVMADGGWIPQAGTFTFNLYRPPPRLFGEHTKVGPWVEHIRNIYPNEIEHIISWLAHRLQRPGEKINHALVLGGGQGIGKDTMLEPVKRAVGPWNFSEVNPAQMLGRFNTFLKSVILRINEARDLGEVNRFAFYDHLKAYTAAPPDVLRVDQKHLQEHNVMNVTGVIITTNHKSDGIYLPADDRRHFVAWSNAKKEDFPADYWTTLWNWYVDGGIGHVADYLSHIDLSPFDAKAPPPKTQAFYEIVNANHAPENAPLADALELMGNPGAVTLDAVLIHADPEFAIWARDRKSRRMLPHRFEECGYVPVRSESAKDGLWKINGRRQVIYARHELSLHDQIAAAKTCAGTAF